VTLGFDWALKDDISGEKKVENYDHGQSLNTIKSL
jgi:hypothetical protein